MGCSKGCWKCSKRKNSDSESLSSDIGFTSVKRKWPLWKKILVGTLVTLLVLCFLIFILVWIVTPIVFWLSIAFQRLVVFFPIDSPKNPNFDNPTAYNIEGVHNFYIAVVDYHNNRTITKIGAWLILPEDDIGKVTSNDILEIIRDTQYDILIFLHGVACNRAKAIWNYGVMRKEFMVIAVDHRGYGDSGLNVELTELGIVHDHLQVYDWLIDKNFTNDIYYWGHSLGSALSCHVLKALKEERNVVPKGLILESAFTTLAEEVKYHFLGKIFKWLVYFNATILYPLDYNGFHFYSTSNILYVDCPIMLMHAENDEIIPWGLGKKLADIATTQRDILNQGNVTFHLIPPTGIGYGHTEVTRDPNVPQYIRDFKRICQNFTGS